MWEREEYWSRIDRPEGCWYTCAYCWRMDDEITNQLNIARKHIADAEKRKLKQNARNGRHVGAWELCLNYSPKWYENDYEAQEALRLAITRLTGYYKNEIKEFKAVGEFTKNGCSHVHVYYELHGGGKITDKNLKRAYPHWDAKVKVGTGNQGGNHKPVVNDADYRGYIEKDLDVSWFVVDIPNAISEVQQVQIPTLPEA